MSKQSPKTEKHLKCDACDFQKLKQYENNPAVRNLRDKVEHLNFRLSDCKSENQMLKKNLQLAKTMMFREVGDSGVSFQALVKHGTGEGCKGRQENVLVLKKKVQEIKDYLKELEGDQPATRETPSETYVRHKMPNDKKKLWRMGLERRLAKESSEKNIEPLIRECHDLRKLLNTEKNRFKELNEEVKLLRAELQSQVALNDEDISMINSFNTLEKQLQEVQAERAEIRDDLNGFRNRNKMLAEEVGTLKKELELLQKKASVSNAQIDSLTNSHKTVQESINVEKVIVQQNVARYKEELELLMKNHATDVEILDQLQNLMFDRRHMLEELKSDVDAGLLAAKRSVEVAEKEKEKLNDANSGSLNSPLSNGSKDLQPSSSKSRETESAETNQAKTSPKSNVPEMRLECEKHKVLCQAAKMESEYLSNIVTRQEKKMNNIADQVVQTGQMIMQKNREKKQLLDKITKLQKSMPTTNRKGKQNVQCKNRLDEIRIKCDIQKDENDFLRNFLSSALVSKTKDVEYIKECIANHKKFFLESTKDFKSLMGNTVIDQTVQQSLEAVDQAEN